MRTERSLENVHTQKLENIDYHHQRLQGKFFKGTHQEYGDFSTADF